MKRYLLIFVLMFLQTVYINAQPKCGDSITDTRDGQKYPTTKIGTQCWMAKNLNAGTFLDVTSVNLIQTHNSISEKYCYFNNLSFCKTYGGLYNWEEAMYDACPSGWHLPSTEEFDTLINFFPPFEAVRELLPGGSSGFNLDFPGYGWYNGTIWKFYYSGGSVFLRTSTEDFNPEYAFVVQAHKNDTLFNIDYQNKTTAYSVRCIRDYINSNQITKDIEDVAIYLIYTNAVLEIKYVLPAKFQAILFNLINAEGKVIAETHLISGETLKSIPISNLKPGVYIGKIFLPNGEGISRKLIVY